MPKPAAQPTLSPRRASPWWHRWVALVLVIAVLGWLGAREWRARQTVHAASALQAALVSESRFAEVQVMIGSNSQISVLAPNRLSTEAKDALERLVAQHTTGFTTEVHYEASKPNLPPAAPLPDDKFLGLRDEESRKISDTAPEAAVGSVTDLTTVSERPYTEYERALASGDVKAHGTRDGFLYYAVEVGRHVPFPNGTSAWVFITERFKARLPGK